MSAHMPDRADVERIAAQLVTTGEIARRIGVRQNVVSNWSARFDSFPRPVATYGKATVYYWRDVATWLWVTGKASPRVLEQ